MSERTIFLDIETIPTQSQAARERIAAGVKPPASMSKPETIAKWEAESKPQAVADAIAKTSFDPAYGHICTIAWAIDDAPVFSYQAVSEEYEADTLGAFFDAIDSHHHATFVGHYVAGFDLRFILCRAVVLGIKIPSCIPRDPKPWGGRVFDTMTAWAGPRDTISMDKLAEALGIEGKGDFSGGDVAGAFERGEYERIREYCEADVDRTREIWRKFKAAGF
jgi:3'-5' exonuclease